MKILAFDTSGSGASIALNQGEKNLTKITIHDNKQSEILISSFEDILQQNNIWYDNLNAIAAISGPGSFTGIRVGLSTARTLKIATNLPLILLNSLEVIAFQNNEFQGEIFVAIDAKMDELFIGNFDSKKGKIKEIGNSKIANLDNILDFLPKEKFLLCGNAKKIIAERIRQKNFDCKIDKDDSIQADFIANLAYQKIMSDEAKENLEAFYLRDPKITARKKQDVRIGGRGRNRTDA